MGNSLQLQSLDVNNLSLQDARDIWCKYDKDRNGVLDLNESMRFLKDYISKKKLDEEPSTVTLNLLGMSSLVLI